MIVIIFFPLLVFVLSLIVAFLMLVFLRRYLWKLCKNKVLAFTVGAVVFLILSKLFSILASLLLFLVARLLAPEIAQLLGILAFSYGDKLIYFYAIAPTFLACVAGFIYIRTRIIYAIKASEADVSPTKSRLFLQFATVTSVLVFLFALFGPWGPLYGTVTIPTINNFPKILATLFRQPRFCSLMPGKSFDPDFFNTPGAGIRCLRDSQTEKEYYAHCELIPLSTREDILSGFFENAPDYNGNPYQECVTHQAQLLAQDTQSSISLDDKAATCNGIKNLARRAVCLLPYISTQAWTSMCSASFNAIKKGSYYGSDDNNGKDAVIIGQCLDKKTINELDADGTPLWFNAHIITGYDKYGVPIKTPDILYWLSSIGVNPNSVDLTGKNYLSYILDSALGSKNGQAVENSYATDFVKLGVNVHSKDSSGLSAMDYAFEGGYSKLVYGLLPLFKDYKPSAEVITSFLTTCHDGKERGTAQDECYGLFDGEHYEQARKDFSRLGLLGISAIETSAAKISDRKPIDSSTIRFWFEESFDTKNTQFVLSPLVKISSMPKLVFVGTKKGFDKSIAKDHTVYVSGSQVAGSIIYTSAQTPIHSASVAQDDLDRFIENISTDLLRREYIWGHEYIQSIYHHFDPVGWDVFDELTNRWYAPAIFEKNGQQTVQFYLVNNNFYLVEASLGIDRVPLEECPIDQKNGLGECDIYKGFHFKFFISDPIPLDKLKS
ncbi:MAG: hypothetical protein NTZ87_02125 [Candidatus Nomurabacteria bacterium]|nr:hypothetical protein [Candidatus Nomurabacteria bacterium]